MDARPLRIGTLGAARITPTALIKPARKVEDAEVVAVAARDPERARRFAAKHGIAKVHDSYDALLADSDVEAVYNPLPNGLHALWTLKALEAGKHVLCEKPFAANAEEAQEVADAAASSGRVVMEAFHYRYHPLADRMRDIVASGVLGPIRRIETWMCFPLPNYRNIRYRLDLAGGATMDAGCYAIHMLRLLAGTEPIVTRAEARLARPQVDRWMRADFDIGAGQAGRMTCSMLSSTVLKMAVRVTGQQGEMRVTNPVAPHLFHRLRVRTGSRWEHERVAGAATYVYQLRAFTAAARRGAPILTPPADSVANMAVIDAVYRAAGLEPRAGARR